MSGAYPPDIQKIVDRGTLIIGLCKTDQPPFYSHDSKTASLTGYDIMFAKGLAERLGVKAQFQQTAETWNDLIPMLIEEKIDLAISFLSKTAERSKKILFSQAYAKVHQAILLNRLNLTREKAIGHNTLEKVFQKNSEAKLIVYEGSSYEKFATSLLPDVSLLKYKTQKEIINVLWDGIATGFLADEVEVMTYLRENPESTLRFLPVLLKNNYDLIAVGLPIHSTALQGYVNTYIETNNLFIEGINDIVTTHRTEGLE